MLITPAKKSTLKTNHLKNLSTNSINVRSESNFS